MKDERIVEAFEKIEPDDLARQRMFAALLAERESMQACDASAVDKDVSPAGGDVQVNAAPTRRHSRNRTTTVKVIFGIAACLLVAFGAGALTMPRLFGGGTQPSSSSSLEETSGSTPSNVVEMTSAAPPQNTLSTTSGTTPKDLADTSQDMATAESDIRDNLPPTFEFQGVTYHIATADETTSAALSSPLDENAAEDNLGTTQAEAADGSTTLVSVSAIDGVSAAEMVAARAEDGTEWWLYVAD